MAKYPYIVNTLRQRVLDGDYTVNSFPAEALLAAEFHVSHMTARRAVQTLINEGLIIRHPYGGVEINRNAESGGMPFMVAYLMPAFASEEYQRWMRALSLVASEQHVTLRMVMYTRWNDPIITDTLEQFDGVFLFPASDPVPPHVVERLKKTKRLVALDYDMSAFGVPSLCPIAAERACDLFEYLCARGYQRIDYLNTQPEDIYITDLMRQYQEWIARNACTGVLRNHPVRSYESPRVYAYQQMREILAQQRPLPGTALMCTPYDAAVGAIRALHEAGIRVGADVGV
ncbi:MAG TPA: substrate-binding domain-containing protein, partial [Armatimonadota bacterium]|nr:substrate-binding domain-containing protein [Armatimonadota bacterium]